MCCNGHQMTYLTLLVLELKYSRNDKSILWLPVHWLLVLQGNLDTRYWQCVINMSLSFMSYISHYIRNSSVLISRNLTYFNSIKCVRNHILRWKCRVNATAWVKITQPHLLFPPLCGCFILHKTRHITLNQEADVYSLAITHRFVGELYVLGTILA